MPFLPPHLENKLNFNILAGTIYSNDQKKFGNLSTFKPFINDLNKLAINGLQINNDGNEQKVFFRCPLIEGDNIGLNEICGFNFSFNSTSYCRICRASSVECHFMCEEDKGLLRY